jgi:hypothetical protein
MWLLLNALAIADDDGTGPELLTDPTSIDLSEGSGEGALTYSGSQNGRAANYKVGAPIAITHSSGNLAVRCVDTDRFSANLQYTVYGSAEGPMESTGNGVGLAVWGDSKGGGVKTRIPSKVSGVARVDVELTVSVPRGATALSVSHSGAGWVQVLDCTGKVSVSSGRGGLYASGAMASITANASGGDAKVVVAADAVLSGTSSVSAPAGNATLQVSTAQGGKLTAKGAAVSVTTMVMGTNTPTLVQGTMGVNGPSITVSAKGNVEVSTSS